MRIIATTLALIVLPPFALAHHSTFSTFNGEVIDELEGEITQVVWRNPHVRFTIRVGGNEGSGELWDIETTSLSSLRQLDLTNVVLAVGERIIVAGNPSRAGSNDMWATNLLLEDQREIVLGAESEPRWSDQALGKSGSEYATEGDASEPERGIYRVWSSTAATPMLLPETVDETFDLETYPLTDSAREVIAAHDPQTDNPTANCTPKGMPTIMEQPYPMEIAQQGQNILLRTEEYDLVRTIHMNSESVEAQTVATPLGYSVGRMEAGTLVVTTKYINWGHFDQAGIPLSEAVEIVEYFTPVEDGSRMEYRMIVTDPSTFTEPVELQKHWLYVPGVTVQPYECLIG
jgi:hypothetical protein